VRRSNDSKNPALNYWLISVFRFPLASLSIGPILQQSTIHRRRETLNNMTKELNPGNIYGATIDRVRAQGGDKPRLGMEALMWIIHAERPLGVEELCHALAVEIGSTDFNVDNIPSISTVLSCCQGLISVDRETSTVRLINFTLQKYLSSCPHVFGEYEPHSTMAEICLTYLNSAQVKAISADTSPGALDTPFLEYSSIYWGVHANRKLSDRATSLALQLFQEYNRHVSANILEHMGHLGSPDQRTGFGISLRFSGLHCASFFGIGELVEALIETGYSDVNEGDSVGYTPLAWAAHNGHDEVVEILLEPNAVNLDKPDNNGITPLSQAARNGHEEVVKILIQWDQVNPDKPDNNGRTPLTYAAWAGREGVVKLLLEREEVDPDAEDDDGRTPLSYAAENGHGGVVEMLLERGGFCRADNAGRTPLSYAAGEGHEGVVKIFLGLNVSPNWVDNDGRTPLMLAEMNGHKNVVELLNAYEFPEWSGYESE